MFKLLVISSLLLSSFVNLFAIEKEDFKYQVSACLVFQNEAPYLKEWIEFHKLVGIEHFYFYNNLSTDNFEEVLAPYIAAGEVEIRNWNYDSHTFGGHYWNQIQLGAYNDGLRRAKGHTKWLAILDSDEYLFPVEQKSLVDFLKDFESYGVVGVNWQMFGTSGIKKLSPDRLLIEELIFRGPVGFQENVHIKSIIRPECALHMISPHSAMLIPGTIQVNPHKKEFIGPFTEITVDKLRINHYWTRDEHFLHTVKIGRRGKVNDEIILWRADQLNQELDTEIYKYVPDLRKAMLLD